MLILYILSLIAEFIAIAIAQKDPHYVGNRTTMVHLFEWKFQDIAKECERFLGPMGYAGVQVSPIHENLILPNRPWYERYQPISYKLITRSGNEAAFKNMVKRCNKVGVRIYVDAVVNHMCANSNPAIGTGGSTANPQNLSYPAVPYTAKDFNTPCAITNYSDPKNPRDCELEGLHDLDQSKESVRKAIVGFFDKAVDLGVAGFRIDAAKHMWPKDLKVVYSRIKNLSTTAGFPPNSRPFIFQEVIDLGTDAQKKSEYNSFGDVIEFQYGIVVGQMFRGQDKLARLANWGEPDAWYLLPSEDVVVMVDNHDNQRGHGAGGASILSYKSPKQYKMAIAFMQAHPYGNTRVMSSFKFDDPSQGPPSDPKENILSPKMSKGVCINGWVCEHRWSPIYNMVKFRNIVKGTNLENWWSNGNNQIAFSRGNRGFVAFNVEDRNLRGKIQTGLTPGVYCDVISGSLENGKCTGQSIIVGRKGMASINIPADAKEGVVAIHIGAKLR